MISKGITHLEMIGTADDIVCSDNFMKRRRTGERSGVMDWQEADYRVHPFAGHPSGFWIAEMGGKVDRT